MRCAVLAMLLVDAGQVMPAGQLIDELWRGREPAAAATTLRSYISRLRSVLEPEASLDARAGGYVVNVGTGQLDVAEFEEFIRAGQAALDAGMAGVAGDRFRAALALWRGPALAGVADVPMLALESARLEELRLVAVEGRMEAELALGRHAEVTGELERLVANHPVRERFWCQLVLALYRGERQADALAACRRARAMLAEELGLEPGEQLRRLEQEVLRHEVSGTPEPEQHNLPVPLTSLLGRDLELGELERLLAEVRLISLTGPGGTGKTRLAVECARRVAGRYPDGVWLTDLAGISAPELVPAQVMAALGVRQSGDVPVMEALRFRLRSAELLVVLDNCEHLIDACAQLAADLLGSVPGLRMLATSREPLGVPGEVTYGVPPLGVPPESAGEHALAESPAVRLFLERASAARAGSSQTAAPIAAVARICRDLDGLPLPIELAAARASVVSVPEIQARLADKFRFLAYRRPIPGARHQALKAAIDWSHELLTEPEARVFRELSVFSGSFRLAEVAAVCCHADEGAALETVDQLAAKSFVVIESAAGATRYRLLQTLREYAADRLAETGEAPRVRQLHATAFRDLAERAPDYAILAREHDNLLAALGWSLSANTSSGDQTGQRLACALGGFWRSRGYLQEARDWLERALAAPTRDRGQHAKLHWLLGAVLHQAGDLHRARAVLADGSRAAAAAGEDALRARMQVLLAEIRMDLGADYAELLADEEAAAAILGSEGDCEGLAEAWNSIGWLRFASGDVPASQKAVERAAAYAARSGNQFARLTARQRLILTLTESPIPTDVAIARAEQLLEAAPGDPWAEVQGVEALAELYAYAGRFADARQEIARARSAYVRSGDKFSWAVSAYHVGRIEMTAGDYPAAERVLADGREALIAIGERGVLSSILAQLAEAAYAQGHLDEALQLTEETGTISAAGDVDAQARWRATRAKLLARQAQFPAARQLAGEAVKLAAATSYSTVLAHALTAAAEVSQLAGAPEEAEASLRAALSIYEERNMPPLAERARAALASLAARRHASSG